MEAFIRRNMGLRYFSPTNYVCGLVTLGFYSGFIVLSGTPSAWMMGFITLAYSILGAYRLLRQNVRYRLRLMPHSVYVGESVLGGLEGTARNMLNSILDPLALKLGEVVLSRDERARQTELVPFLTERSNVVKLVIEPLLFYVLAGFCFTLGLWAVSLWIMIAGTATVVHTALAISNERNALLDYYDTVVVGQQLQYEQERPDRLAEQQAAEQRAATESVPLPELPNFEQYLPGRPTLARASAAVAATMHGDGAATPIPEPRAIPPLPRVPPVPPRQARPAPEAVVAAPPASARQDADPTPEPPPSPTDEGAKVRAGFQYPDRPLASSRPLPVDELTAIGWLSRYRNRRNQANRLSGRSGIELRQYAAIVGRRRNRK